jgi:hypothetical protein
MEFLKKNYEKLLLSAVLLSLTVAAALLPSWVSSERRRLDDIVNWRSVTPPKERKPVLLITNETVLRRLKRPEPVRFSGVHNVFNPVQWKRMPDGNLIKVATGDEIGPGALKITTLRPLNLIVAYDGVTSGDLIQHRIKVTREADKSPSKRSPTTRPVVAAGNRNDIFAVKEIKPTDDPQEFVLEMLDSKQTIEVTKDKPFISVAGYVADLRYEPEKLSFPNRRVDDRLVFSGDTNKIVAITETTVTVEALSNTKRTTIVYRGASAESGR